MSEDSAVRGLLVSIPWVVAVSAAWAGVGACQETDSTYLARAHSHNDYQRTAPLTDAVARGFGSIEVDVVLRDGELFVAHEEGDVVPALTLRGLYLDSLRELARESHGWIYTPDRPLQLLVDVKTEAEATYRALDEVLGEYDDLFTRWTSGGRDPGPVTAVLSGNRAVSRVESDTLRYMAVDGRVGEARTLPPDVMALVSVDWEDLGSTREERLTRARRLVDTVHAEGRKIRFWGTPDEEDLWATLLSADVDYIGTDEPARLERLLRSRAGSERPPPVSSRNFISRRSSTRRRTGRAQPAQAQAAPLFGNSPWRTCVGD